MALSPGHLLVALLSRDAVEREFAACIPLYLDDDFVRIQTRINHMFETHEALQNSNILSINLSIQDIKPEDEKRDRRQHLDTIEPNNPPLMATALEKLSYELHKIKVKQVCKEHGIEAPEEIEQLECIVSAFHQMSPVLPRTAHIPIQVMDYEQDYEIFALKGPCALREFCHHIYVARRDVARLLYRRNWPEESLTKFERGRCSQTCGSGVRQLFEPCKHRYTRSFRFLDLPPELRLKIYGLLLPRRLPKASKTRCALNDTTLFVTMSALPGLRPALSADCPWDYNHEHVLPLMLTCQLMHREVANIFFAQCSQEISVTDQNTSWLGSDHWNFGGHDPVHPWFSRLRNLRLTISSSTEPENMMEVKARLRMVVAELQKLEDLRELDIVYLPVPYDRKRSTPPSVSLEEVDTHLIQPLLELNGIEKVSMRFEDPPEPTKADQREADDNKKGTQGTPLAWSWRKDFVHLPRYLAVLKWCLPNKLSEEFWKEIKENAIDKVIVLPKVVINGSTDNTIAPTSTNCANSHAWQLRLFCVVFRVALVEFEDKINYLLQVLEGFDWDQRALCLDLSILRSG
jgi:hypothetical protein